MTAPLAQHRSSWSPARRTAAGLFLSVGLALLLGMATQGAALLFLLMNKADPTQVRWLSLLHYWQLYAEDPPLRRQLIISMLVCGTACLVITPAALVMASRPRRSLHGDARFASPSEVRQAGLLSSPVPGAPGILIGRYRAQFLVLTGQLSVMLSAPTRSGKGTGIVVPNLLHWPHSVVVLDVKGENFAITAGFRARHGQAVYAFSPFDDQARSHRWNPLSAVRPAPQHRVGDLLTMAQVLFPTEGNCSASEAFFNDQARNLFLALGLLLLETPELPRTIGEILRQASGQGLPLKSHLAAVIAQRQAGSRPLSSTCLDALNRLLSNSENTLSSIVATLNAPLVIFADPVVDAATSGDDFDLDQLRRSPMSVYVRVPPNRLATARPLLNLFFSQLIHLNTRLLPEEDSSLRLQCLVINDEFAALGRLGILVSAAAYLAGYNLRLLTVVQAMSQLDAIYGDKDARTFATNHGLQVLFAPREQRDADEYSAMLGHYTTRAVSRGQSRSFSVQGHRSVSLNESEQRRALLLPQEFKELGADRLVAILEHCKPIVADKLRYFSDPVFEARLCKPPAVPRLDMDLHEAKCRRRTVTLPDILADGDDIDHNALVVPRHHLPDAMAGRAAEVAQAHLDAFAEGMTPRGTAHPDGEATPGTVGDIRPLPDGDDLQTNSTEDSPASPPTP